MSDKQTYTRVEFVKGQRDAFVEGVCAERSQAQPVNVSALLTKYYPLPKVTRPRVVTAPRLVDCSIQRQFRYADGQIQTRAVGESAWVCCANGVYHPEGLGLAITPARVAMWADLIANPTEEVEAES